MPCPPRVDNLKRSGLLTFDASPPVTLDNFIVACDKQIELQFSLQESNGHTAIGPLPSAGLDMDRRSSMWAKAMGTSRFATCSTMTQNNQERLTCIAKSPDPCLAVQLRIRSLWQRAEGSHVRRLGVEGAVRRPPHRTKYKHPRPQEQRQGDSALCRGSYRTMRRRLHP